MSACRYCNKDLPEEWEWEGIHLECIEAEIQGILNSEVFTDHSLEDK
tara:strand:+ start:29 stop:169 length:141 start_codon:yes stop_codon:yes gene_type:complete